MAAHQKKARRQGASLAILDESGLLMAPLVRRSWALRGQPPALGQRTAHREKVSIAAALWLTPRRDRLGLSFATLVNDYFDNEASAVFLEAVVQERHGPVVALWDGGSMHKGDPIAELVERLDGRLSLESVPSHTPELIPVEPLWSWLKYGRLCNFAPGDAQELEDRAVAELSAIRDDQELLRSFFHASELPLPRTLLS